MNSNFPYLEFLEIAKAKREEMILDTYEENSPDLYDALYSNPHQEISKIKLEYYELKWIESYWKSIESSVASKEFSDKEKKELISKFSKWYDDFICGWNYTSFDAVVSEERRKILKALITVNNDWEKNIKRMNVLFEKDFKTLNKKIQELQED